jgi:hypothetical protein
MNRDEFCEAVQCAAAYPGEWPKSPLLAEREPDRRMDEESASDSGAEL